MPGLFLRVSNAIGIARVICILGVVYVHAWIGLGGPALAAAGRSAQGLLRWSLVELVGRSAVPLLGMISGWLVTDAVRKRSWARFMTDKARTVLAPMVLWNALAVLLVLGSSWLGLGLFTPPQPTGAGWLVNELTALTRPNQINVQMPFLRDLFICMALAPLLVRAPSGALAAVVAAALAWDVSNAAFPLLPRPSILLFFVIGLLARRNDWARWVAGRPMILTAAPYFVFVLA